MPWRETPGDGRNLMGERNRTRAARVVLTLLLTLPIAGPSASPLAPLAVSANGLGDRISAGRERQQELLAALEHQRELLSDLRADRGLAGLALDGSAKALDGVNADQTVLRGGIERATSALARVEARHDALVLELDELDQIIVRLEVEIAQGDRDLADRRRVLGERLVVAYRTSQTSLLEQILASNSFSDVVVGVDAHLRFGEQDAQFARRIQEDQASLDALRQVTLETRSETDQLRLETVAAEGVILEEQARLGEARRRLAAMEDRTRRLRTAQQEEFERIVGDQGDAQAVIAQTQADEDALRGQIAGLVAEAQRRAEARERRLELARQRRIEERAQRREALERARQRREAREAREEQAQREQQEEREEQQAEPDEQGAPPQQPASRPPPAPRPPRRDGPLDWPTAGYVTQEYGCTGFYLEPRRGSCAHFHDGIDIANGQGTLIRAAAAGVVAFVGYNPYDSSRDRAWVISIGHASSLVTWYSHLQPRYAPGVRQGSRVRQGQVIGYMGNTGNSTGAHLHWEVLRGGSDIDPRSLL